MTPLVSIIIPCYNTEKYIKASLESIINQTYKNIEIIIVNDGSTDRSEEVVKKFTDNRIKYYSQPNAGQCAALNKGFKYATGSLIKFYDSDDLLDSKVIEGQVASLKNTNEFTISFIEWRRFYNNQVPDKIDEDNPHTIHRNCTPVEFITFSSTPPMYQCGIWLIPRNLLLISGLWNEGLSLINDTEFFSRLLTKARLLHFSEVGYTLYRTNTGSASLSSDFSAKGIRSALKSTDLTAKWYLTIENSERMSQLIVKSYLLILEWSYPRHILYSKIILERIRSFTNQPIVLHPSGRIYNMIMKFFGWKVAKHFSYWYYRFLRKR